MLLCIIACLRLDVNNLETTRGIENTITGQMIDIEELTDRKPNPHTRETSNIDTPTTQDKLDTEHDPQELDQSATSCSGFVT